MAASLDELKEPAGRLASAAYPTVPQEDKVRDETVTQNCQREIGSLQKHENGLQPQNTQRIFRAVNVEPAELSYHFKTPNACIEFWEGLWDTDVFVSFLFEFAGVLHMRKIWDTPVIQNMFKEKFVIIADKIAQYILMPRGLTAACQKLSTSSLMRISVDYAPDLQAVYTKLKEANVTLSTAEPGISSYTAPLQLRRDTISTSCVISFTHSANICDYC
ncbi:hypothetical protein BKA63DRAFT_561855 [Paraphoma chrysanthemicola]|nr:hypothetical protein BKA63DRAFT_561855 [Paraphoma chrysanthemicola]